MKRGLIACVAALTVAATQAQTFCYDPTLDPQAVTAQAPTHETWDGTSYIWYPGQLAAYRQQWLRAQSRERCVNVGYPGKFNPTAQQTMFRKTVKLNADLQLQWQAAGASNVTAQVDGQAATQGITLKRGRHTLLFNVQTSGQLPALIVRGIDAEGWQASLDNALWMPAETDARYDTPSLSPNSRINQSVSISPKNYIALKNASIDGDVLTLGQGGMVIADFWYDEVGTVSLTATGNSTLHFTVGESIEEVLNEDTKRFEQQPIEDSAAPGNISLPERGLRYVKITASQPCTVSNISFDMQMWPADYHMDFECSDQELNQLWSAGMATMHTSMHDFNLDGIKRDFLPWSMDASISALGMALAFDDRQVVRNDISVSLMPPSPTEGDWGIVDYPLHALLTLQTDYLRYADLSSVNMYRNRIDSQMDLYMKAQDARGFISASQPTSGFIPGWSRDNGPESYGIASYPQMLLYANFRIAARFARLLGDNSRARQYTTHADALRESIISVFWDDSRKAFINGLREDGTPDTRLSHHAQYWAVLTDLYPAKDYDTLFDSVLPSIPRYKDNISYEKGYEALAYIKAGRTADFRQLLHDVWGDWLRQGYSRFPENFSYSSPVSTQLMFYGRPYGLSLCHGANGVPPIVLAARGILGLHQSDTDPHEFTLCPDLMDLNYACGNVPVADGTISINLTRSGNCTVQIPDGCTMHIGTKTYRRAGTYSFTLADCTASSK